MPDLREVDRHFAPAEKRVTFFADDALDDRLARRSRFGIVRQEHESRAIRALRGQVERHHAAEEPIGRLDEDAGAVAGVRIGSAGAAVFEVDEEVEGRSDYLV